LFGTLSQAWRLQAGSKTSRILLISVTVFALLRLLMQFAVLPELYFDDLTTYLDASQNLRQQTDLYPPLPLKQVEFYQYAPTFALVMVPFTWISTVLAGFLHTALHVVIYALLYRQWDRIFKRLGLEQASRALIATLPVWLLFSAFWSDLILLNVYTLMALLATLLIDAVLDERLDLSLLWLSIILQLKPHMAFAVLIPLLLGHYRFFFKLILAAAAVYVAIFALTILVLGPHYGWEQYKAYFHLLTAMGDNFPWRGPSKDFLGYNHSIVQTVVFFGGISTTTLRIGQAIKFLLLVPLVIIGLRFLRHPVRKMGREVPELGLELAFVLYTGVFIWLDIVWELTLGIAVFTYLLAVLNQSKARTMMGIVFLLYSLVDVFQLVGYMVLGENALLQDAYVVTDISTYVPLIMIVTLTFYVLLIKRLWAVPLEGD
jgi:hypothetical protein